MSDTRIAHSVPAGRAPWPWVLITIVILVLVMFAVAMGYEPGSAVVFAVGAGGAAIIVSRRLAH